MADGPVPTPRERGWVRIVLALAAFLLLPHAPTLPAALPVVDTLLLLVPALAACFIVGWWAGGSFALAVVWAALSAWVVLLPPPHGVGGAYYDLARAWGLLVAGAFGIVCLVGRPRPFLHRALAAIGVAALASLVLMAFARTGPRQAERVFAEEFVARNAASATIMQQSAVEISQRLPDLGAMATDVASRQAVVEEQLTKLATPLYAAMLALEALAACALAWALYHRLSRARLGLALAPIRSLRFSDQLIWALIAGTVMLLVPSLTGLGGVGRNLLIFFGVLYALRGYGVFASFLSRRAATASLAAAVVLFPLSLLTAPAALGLGISDTWFDWRARLGPTARGHRP